VLDGEVAVPCNLQSAIAGVNPFDEGRAVGAVRGIGAMIFWSCATERFEPCQVLTEAALRGLFRVPRGGPK